MGLHDVLDNGEAQSRSTELATACPVDTIKPFEESRQVGRLNSTTLITHAHPHFVQAYASMLCMGRRNAPVRREAVVTCLSACSSEDIGCRQFT